MVVYLLLKPIIPAACVQIQSILVDACSPTESDQEMVFFQVGQNPLNFSGLSVTWPTFTVSGGVQDPWLGLCTNPTFIANVNSTITGGGVVLPAPPSGILPAGANAVLLTSNTPTSSFNSFANLSDTLYVLFQCSGNTFGHFSNYTGTANTIRNLVMNFGAGCTDNVSYNANFSLLPAARIMQRMIMVPQLILVEVE